MPPAARSCCRRCCCCSPTPTFPQSQSKRDRALPVVGRHISFPSSASSLSPPLYSAALSRTLRCGRSVRQPPGFNHLVVSMERLWARGSIDKNKGLVEHLQQCGIIKSRKVAEVMETIDRGLFVPDGSAAYVDSPMPIGYNATISAPHMHATCLELLKDHLQPGSVLWT